MMVEGHEPYLVPTSVRIVASLALIGDVAHHVTMLVLRPRLTEVHPDSPVHHRQVVVRIPRDIQGAYADKPSAVDQLCFNSSDLVRQPLQWKGLAVYLEQIARYRPGKLQSCLKLSMIGLGQLYSPAA